MDSQASFMEETIGEMSDRAGLLDKEKQPAAAQTKAGEDGAGPSDNSKEDRDVILLKKRITANLEA